MRITLEADYALRMICELAKSNTILDAKRISEIASVPNRFSSKILRKLSVGGIVRSYKGANGGYALSRSADAISIKDVLEIIDGPIAISRCIAEGQNCHAPGEEKFDCALHHVFSEISDVVSQKLSHVTIADVLRDAKE